ncbi:MAG: restriction endonuclease subunit S [Caldisericaceae bacterium]
MKKLGDVLALSQSGIWGDEPDGSEEVFPVLRSTEIDHEGNINLNSSTLAWRKVHQNRAMNYALKYGDILVVKSSGSKHLLGRVAYFQYQGEQIFLFSNFLQRLRANESICNSRFLYYMLTSQIAKKFLSMLQETTSGLRNLPIDEYLQMPIPIPPLEEQKRIAGVLRLVDEIAEKTKRIISFYEKVKKYALNQLLTKGIGHSKFKQTEIGELPEEWEVKRLGDIATIRQGRTLRRSDYKDIGRFKMLKVRDVTDWGVIIWDNNEKGCTDEDLGDEFKLRVEDILVLSASHSEGLVGQRIGFISKLPSNFDKVFFVAELLRVRVNTQFAVPYFVYATLIVNKSYIKPLVKGGHLYPQSLAQLLIPLPPLEEQKKITELLSALDRAIDNERRYLQDLEKLKRWMLDNLLTGKVRLPQEIDELLKEVFYDVF